MRAILVVTC